MYAFLQASVTSSCEANSFHFRSHGKPFSLCLALSPSRGILVIDSIGIGQSFHYSISEQVLGLRHIIG